MVDSADGYCSVCPVSMQLKAEHMGYVFKCSHVLLVVQEEISDSTCEMIPQCTVCQLCGCSGRE